VSELSDWLRKGGVYDYSMQLQAADALDRAEAVCLAAERMVNAYRQVYGAGIMSGKDVDVALALAVKAWREGGGK
jgi:hypothetical protein